MLSPRRLDFDTDLAARLARVRGGNYFSVQSEVAFQALLTEEFNYIVTPQAARLFELAPCTAPSPPPRWAPAPRARPSS